MSSIDKQAAPSIATGLQPNSGFKRASERIPDHELDEVPLYGTNHIHPDELHHHFPHPAHALKSMRIAFGFFFGLASLSLIFFFIAFGSRYWAEMNMTLGTSTTCVHYGLVELCYCGTTSNPSGNKCVEIDSDCLFQVDGRSGNSLDKCSTYTASRVLHVMSGLFVFISGGVVVTAHYWFKDHRPYSAYFLAVAICYIGSILEMAALWTFGSRLENATKFLQWGYGMAALSFAASFLAPIILLFQIIYERCYKPKK